MTLEEIRGNRGGEGGHYDNFPVGMRVLAVDDDPICLKLLEGLLRKCQYHVTTTNQARVALNMLRENKDRFDLVISDVHMPDMDGFKLLELVGLEMDLPVIMLSANSDTKLVMKGVTHGACDYLVKPVRIEELRNIWQHVIRRKKFDSRSQNKSTDQDKSFQGSGEGGQGSQLTGNADQNGKLGKKRKDEDDESDENGHENEDPATQKKPRVVWSIELHRKFVAAVNQLGIEKAVPKRILDLMNVDGLTRENVASHLQKYRLYLKRISSAATQQANMVAALGAKDSAYLRMGSLDGFGDFRTLVGSGRLANSALSSYTPGGVLGRLNSPANVSLRNLTSSALIQSNHSQDMRSSIPNIGKFNSVVSAGSQNACLFQGIPSSLEFDQFQENKCNTNVGELNSIDESRLLSAANTFLGTRTAIPSSTNSLPDAPNNTTILQGNATLTAGGFANQSSLSMPSLHSESFGIGVSGSSNFLDHSRSSENWQNAIHLSKFASESLSLSEPFSQGQLHQNNALDSNALSCAPLQNCPLDFSTPTGSAAFEVSRLELQCQEGSVGDIVQSMNHAQIQRWGENRSDYSHSSNVVFGRLNSQLSSNGVMTPFSHGMDQSDGIFHRKMDVPLTGRSNGGASALLQHNDIEKSTPDSRRRTNEDYLASKPQVGFVSQNYDSLDDLMSAMVKREPDGATLDGEFGFDAYPFGSCV